MEGDGLSLMLGGGAVGAICSLLGTWIKARFSRTELKPDPLHVETRATPDYVRREEFQKHVTENHEHEDANRREHEALYARMNRNDRETSEIKGLLSAIREDIQLIKTKLFKGGK